MMINGNISFSQQKAGRVQLLLFSFMNGIALTFITGNILSLYLLKIGFSTTSVAVLTSFAYAGALFAFTGKWLISTLGASFTVMISWQLCGIATLLIAIIPFAYFQKFITMPEMHLIMGLIVFILFIFKSIGTTALPPLMGEVTENDNQGIFSSKFFQLYNLSTVIAMLCLFFLYSGYKTLMIFQILIFASGVIKLLSSLIIIRVPETPVPMRSAHALNADRIFSLIWKTKQYRKLLIFKSIARAGLILIIPISILALKKTYGVSDQIALIFACVQVMGGFFVTYIYGVISDYTGPKPLIIINLIILIFICLLWIYSPLIFIWQYCALIFFLGGICLFGLDSSLNHYYLTIVSKEDSVGVSLWFTTISGLVAGGSGILLCGGLIKLYSLLAVSSNVFKYYYATLIILLIPILHYACTLKKSSKGDWSVKSVLKLLSAPIKIYSLFSMRTQNKYSSPVDELDYVNKLHGMSSELSEKHLVYYLESPDYFIRSSAILGMYNLTLKEKTKRAVYKALKVPSVSVLLASIILAKNNFTKALPLLRRRLSGTNLSFLWSSMVALSIMKDKGSYNKIINTFVKAENTILVTFGARALAIINDKNTLPCLLEKLSYFFIKGNQDVVDEIVLAISKIISCNDIYYKYIRIYQYDINKGLLDLKDLIDPEKSLGLSTSPDLILKYYYKDRGDSERKEKFLDFLIEALKRDTIDMNKLKVFEDYFVKADSGLVSNRLIACIFIKLFCSNESTANNIQ